MVTFGITRSKDAGIDFSWAKNLKDGNIITSRFLSEKNEAFRDILVQNKEKIILHIICSGFGGTKMEPNVPTKEEIRVGTRMLLNKGFPVDHIVLDLDPIIPTKNGLFKAEQVLELFRSTDIFRARYSIIQLNPESEKRIMDVYGKLPIQGKITDEIMHSVYITLLAYRGSYIFTSSNKCSDDYKSIISTKEYDILGLPKTDTKIVDLMSGAACPIGCLHCTKNS